MCSCWKRPSEVQELEMSGQQTPSELQSEWADSERDVTEPEPNIGEIKLSCMFHAEC